MVSNTTLSRGRRAGWDTRAEHAIVDFLRREHVAGRRELEAKLAERHHHNPPIDPHHLSNGLRALLQRGEVEELVVEGFDGQELTLYTLANPAGRPAGIDAAVRRKRSALAWYERWANPLEKAADRLNPVAEGHERVVHACLMAAAASGIGLGDFERHADSIFGEPAPVGPIDYVARLMKRKDDGRHAVVTLLIECKNGRAWIYPSSPSLYQLLDKAAKIQLAVPDEHIIPILICRRPHPTLFRMAKDLGFRVQYMSRKGEYLQPIRPCREVRDDKVAEVNAVLGYSLERMENHPGLTEQFRDNYPAQALECASRWKDSASTFHRHFARLRQPMPAPVNRDATMDTLRRAVRVHLRTFRLRW